MLIALRCFWHYMFLLVVVRFLNLVAFFGSDAYVITALRFAWSWHVFVGCGSCVFIMRRFFRRAAFFFTRGRFYCSRMCLYNGFEKLYA